MMSGQCLGMAQGRAGKSLRTGCLAAVVGVVALCAGGYALAANAAAGPAAGVQDGRMRSVSQDDWQCATTARFTGSLEK